MITKRFYCSRPALVMELKRLGYEPRQEVNLYHADRPNWSFELTLDLAKTVNEIYPEWGAKVPAVITTMLGGDSNA